MGLLPGIDASYDELTADEAKRLWDAGVRVFFQCLWTGSEQPPPRVINLRVAQQQGFILGGYISLTPAKAGWEHVESGRAGVPTELWTQLWKVPIDVELPGLELVQVKDGLLTVESYHKPRDIYTSWNVWVNMLGNPPFPADTGLWDANWDGNPNLNYPRPYGGLTLDRVWGKQWRGGSYVAGQYADSDTFLVPDPVPAGPPKPTADDIQAALRVVAWASSQLER